jgi:hypothetical protein
MGECTGVSPSGTITFDIDADGVATGEINGNTSGPLEGTVDMDGAFESTVMTGAAGECTFDGQFDNDDLMIAGTWMCPDLECVGTWTAGPAM